MNRKGGFTLLELLIVVTLVLTLSSLAVASFIRTFQARSQEHFTKEMASYIRYLQFRAVEEGLALKLGINPDTGTVQSLVKSAESSEYEPFATPFSKRFEKENVFDVQIQPNNEIYFFPDGSVTPGKVVIKNNKDEESSVEIKNRLGALEVR